MLVDFFFIFKEINFCNKSDSLQSSVKNFCCLYTDQSFKLKV